MGFKMDLDLLLKDIDACIFDMDGTLIDSIHVWHDIDIEFMGRFNLDADLEEYQKNLSGLSFKQVAEYTHDNYPIPMSVEEIMDEWNRMAEHKYAYEIQFKPGAEAFLGKLKSRGLKLGVATSNCRNLVDKLIPRLGIDRFLSVVVTGDDISHGKPEPDIYLKAAGMLDTDPSRCLVFEDVIPGVEAGKRAGMRVCAVYDEASAPYADTIKSGSDYYLESYLSL